ncbi:MAG: putative acyl carrier protein phosphodiesterase [Microbacteriaceae bacterium]|jgi:FMN-dependent NADH-azoreductase|nr:putative acyl carrier protein phosphodiesterase [Microbacteriaceae bacterium]
MATIFRLDASIRNEGSVTRAVATSLQNALLADAPDTKVIRRDLGGEPLPSPAWAHALAGSHTPAGERTAEQREALALASQLGDELAQADAFIFAIPMYNFGVPPHAKAWIDVLISDPRFSPRSGNPIAGRPAYLVLARGGTYGPGTPREGWDHATEWLKLIFGRIWSLDLIVIETELTAADVSPALAEFRELAAENLKRAHAAATGHGTALAERLREAEAA